MSDTTPFGITRVLVVEDSPDDADLEAGILASAGHSVDTARSVDDALRMLKDAPYRLVVLDADLDRDAAALHAVLAARGASVLVVSGVTVAKMRAVTEPHGWSFLRKPVEPGALLDRVATLLARSSGGSSPPGLPSPPTQGRLTPVMRPPTIPPAAPLVAEADVLDATIVDMRTPLPERDAPPSRPTWVDALRVVLDRAIYAGALVVLYRLRTHDQLDVGTVTAVLLVSGVRPHNLFDAAKLIHAKGGAAALLLMFVPLVAAARSGSWLPK